MNKPKMRGAGQPPRRYATTEWVRAYAAWVLLLPVYLSLWAFTKLVPTLPQWAVRLLRVSHNRTTASRPPDFRIPVDPSVGVYMQRWWKIRRNWAFNIYYHIVHRSDDDTALHDHPWWSFSIVLEGGYYEHRIADGGTHSKTWYGPGSVLFRRSGSVAHRLELARDEDEDTGFGSELSAKTIFVTGPVLRRWGFHHSSQWVDAYAWDDFCTERGISKTNDVGNYGQLLEEKGQRKDV